MRVRAPEKVCKPPNCAHRLCRQCRIGHFQIVVGADGFCDECRAFRVKYPERAGS